MLKRCVPFVAILLAFAITASADAAQRQRRAKPEEPPPPPQFKVEVATRTIQMTQVKNSVPKGATVGKLLSGCTFRGAGGNSPIRSEDVFQDDRAEDYIREFANEASLAGYRLAGSQGGNLFDSADQRGAELLIGAVITSLKEESCWQEWTSPHMETEVTMGVEWQVFDPLEKKIVHRQSMDVSKTVKATEIAPVILALAARETFRAAAKNLVADPNFVAAVKDPKGGAPANSDSLFPEATSSAPAAAPTQIPRLALSGADFRAQVGTLRQQVVTILTPGGTGSGFYISSNLLLTNYHVIDGYTDVKIKFFGGREIAGRVVSSHARRDIALLQTESQPVSGLPLRLEPPPETSPVYVIGSPLGQEHEGSISAGIVSGFREIDLGPMIQSDVGVTFGNSGGPMFDDKGNVIALVDIGIPDDNRNPTQVNLFIPIADALKVLQIAFAPTAAAAK